MFNHLKFIRYIVKHDIINPKTGEIINDSEVVIKIKNTLNGKSRIHRLTSFLNQYRNNKIKYVSDIADDIVIFLNYIYFELRSSELSNINFLTFDIGAKFLENYSMEKTKNTTVKMERNLTKFYYFLASNDVLKNIAINDFVKTTSRTGKTIIQSPFDGKYRRFSKEKPLPLHDLSPELLILFLETAKEIAPQITLGIYMQIFGGLRVSEVITLSYSNIRIKGINARNGIVANVKSTNLRNDLISSGVTGAKKERTQIIIGIPSLIEDIYVNHLKNHKSPLSNALFINNKNQALTVQMYRYYFNKVKETFIRKLLNSNNLILKSNGIFLNSQRWSTHIGRGIFSNLIAKNANNIIEISAWRGDSNLDSSLSYISDHLHIEEKISKLMDEYYSKHLIKNHT